MFTKLLKKLTYCLLYLNFIQDQSINFIKMADTEYNILFDIGLKKKLKRVIETQNSGK